MSLLYDEVEKSVYCPIWIFEENFIHEAATFISKSLSLRKTYIYYIYIHIYVY